MNVEEFVKLYAQKLSIYPECIEVKSSINESEKICNIVIYANNADVGRLVGKDGKMISSIKTVISGCKAKNGMCYRIVVESL